MFGVGFVAVLAVIVIKSNKRNPRLVGNRLMNKGLLVFAVGWLVAVMGSSSDSSTFSAPLQIVGFSVAVIGFGISVVGWFKHVKLMFKPLDSEDIKRINDPGYDIPYTECPHCHKVEVRVSGSKTKCPKCDGIIRPDVIIDA